MNEEIEHSRTVSAGDSPGIFQTLDRVDPSPYSRGEYARRAAWALVQATLFRLSPTFLYGWRRFLLRLFGAQLASSCGIQPTVRIVHPWLLKVGRHSMIGAGTTIYNLGPVTIGEHTVISQNCFLCAGTHDHMRPTLPLLRPPIAIGSGVWVAVQVFVGPGVSIGDNSVIGARSVVTRDVEAGVVAAGNPCRTVGPREMHA